MAKAAKTAEAESPQVDELALFNVRHERGFGEGHERASLTSRDMDQLQYDTYRLMEISEGLGALVREIQQYAALVGKPPHDLTDRSDNADSLCNMVTNGLRMIGNRLDPVLWAFAGSEK